MGKYRIYFFIFWKIPYIIGKILYHIIIFDIFSDNMGIISIYLYIYIMEIYILRYGRLYLWYLKILYFFDILEF